MKMKDRNVTFLKKAACMMKRAAGSVWGWIKKHKVLTAVLAAVLLAGAFAAYRFLPAKPGVAAASYSFVRTVTLSRGDLDSTVSTTGTVESSVTSTVSYASGGMAQATVATVEVAVGDEVEEGDVIITLNSDSIKESIAKEEEALAERVAQAKEDYEAAAAAYNDAVAVYEAYEATVSAALTEQNNAYVAYQKAVNSVFSFETAYNNAASAQEKAGIEYNSKLAAYNAAAAALSDGEAALQAAETDEEKSAATAALTTLQQAELDAKAAMETAKAAYEAAQSETQDALSVLNDAKKACNYDSYASAYTQAQKDYTSARTQLDQYEAKVESAKETMDRAKETYDEADESETLESLYEQLAQTELTAQTSGKVTALNVRVGDTVNGTIATIQDTDALKISISISEADINSVSVGMRCRITSDATEGEVSGTLTQIDPITSQSGSFGAEVTVNQKDTGLLIGMNASVEIILSSTSDCFTVPIDAVGNDNDGKGDYIYRSTGGEGVDMTFEKVYVTTGESNDYYIEISGSDLAEGDVIRASADLTQGIETAESGTEEDTMTIPGMGGFGDMGGFGGDGGGMPDFGGGMPSGGDMPGFGGGPSGG